MLRRLVRFAMVLGLCPLVSITALNAQAAPSADSLKHVAIRRLLALQGTDSLMVSGVEQSMPADAPADPNMPSGLREAFLSRVRRDIGQFIERLVPVYDSLYSADDINQLIVFYQSPPGRHLLEVQPRLMVAMAELGRSWGMETAGQVIVDLARRPAAKP